MPLGSALVGLVFLMAVQIGRDLMDPLANDIHDVPMTAPCRTIEIDRLQMIGDPALEKNCARQGRVVVRASRPCIGEDRALD